MTSAGRRRPAALLACGAAAAVVQIAGAIDARGRAGAVVVIAWAAALWLAVDGRARIARCVAPADAALGGAACAAGIAAAIAGVLSRSPDLAGARAVPLVTGLGLVALASGVRALWLWRDELLLLSLPLFAPAPAAISGAIAPVRATAAVAGWLVAAAGLPVSRDGGLLVLEHGSLEVIASCSGLALVSELAAIAVVMGCLVPATPRRRVLLIAAAAATGFLVNAARIAALAIVADRAPDAFDRWHAQRGYGLVALGVAGAAWWLVLRRAPAAEPCVAETVERR